MTKLIEEGLVFEDEDKALAHLLEIDERCCSGKEALEVFLGELVLERALHEKYFNLGRDVYLTTAGTLPVAPLTGVISVLELLKRSHRLILVSCGDEQTQRLKLARSAIAESLFSKIYILPTNYRKGTYALLLSEFEVRPEEVVVCGDRYEVDLKPAQELGMKTILMRWGKGKMDTVGMKKADYTVSLLSEIPSILQAMGERI